MRVKSPASNTASSKLYVYFISGYTRKLIGLIDDSYNYGANELYEKTFFSDEEKYGTIVLAPMSGDWYISSLKIEPYQNIDYSIDSFSIKIPFTITVPNELYEIELELYDPKGNLAYGKGSESFIYNKTYMPLKNRVFIDPTGLTTSVSAAVDTDVIIDGGGAGSVVDIILDGGDASTVYS
jgi:hypothetical protein